MNLKSPHTLRPRWEGVRCEGTCCRDDEVDSRSWSVTEIFVVPVCAGQRVHSQQEHKDPRSMDGTRGGASPALLRQVGRVVVRGAAV